MMVVVVAVMVLAAEGGRLYSFVLALLLWL